MQRRPWPLVILAVVQLVTPLLSLLLSAYVNRVTFGQMATVIWHTSNWLERFQFFLVPLLIGALIYYARLWGFFVVVAYGLIVSYFNVREWMQAQHRTSLGLLIAIELLGLALVVYLCIPKVRAIFFNRRLRWWETKPRYIVNLTGDAKVTSGMLGGKEIPVTLIDLSIGGAGLDAPEEFPTGEKAQVTFRFDQDTYELNGDIVYGRQLATSYRFGVEWTLDGPAKAKYRELITYFKHQRYPETRRPPEWRTDLKGWLARAKKSPAAWVPEIELKRPVKVSPAVEQPAPAAAESEAPSTKEE